MSEKVAVIPESVLRRIVAESLSRAKDYANRFDVGGEEIHAKNQGYFEGRAYLASHFLARWLVSSKRKPRRSK